MTKLSQRTPKGWTRHTVSGDALEKLMDELDFLLGNDEPVESAIWRDGLGKARRVDVLFSNGAVGSVRIDRNGEQQTIEKVQINFRIDGKLADD